MRGRRARNILFFLAVVLLFLFTFECFCCCFEGLWCCWVCWISYSFFVFFVCDCWKNLRIVNHEMDKKLTLTKLNKNSNWRWLTVDKNKFEPKTTHNLTQNQHKTKFFLKNSSHTFVTCKPLAPLFSKLPPTLFWKFKKNEFKESKRKKIEKTAPETLLFPIFFVFWIDFWIF